MDIWSIAIWHGIRAQSIKTNKKENAACVLPVTALCKFVGGTIQRTTIQRTFEHTFVSTTALHSKQQRFKYAWITQQATSTPNLGTHAYMHVSCVKNYFASFGPKNLQFFILACVLRFRTTKSVIAESWCIRFKLRCPQVCSPSQFKPDTSRVDMILPSDLVDSLCRDGTNTQYMQYLSKSHITSPQIH